MSKLTSRKKLSGTNRRYKAEIRRLKGIIKFMEMIKDKQNAGFFVRLRFVYLFLFNKFS